MYIEHLGRQVLFWTVNETGASLRSGHLHSIRGAAEEKGTVSGADKCYEKSTMVTGRRQRRKCLCEDLGEECYR